MQLQLPLNDPADTLVKAAQEAAQDPVFPILSLHPLLSDNFSRVGCRSCQDVQLGSTVATTVPLRLRPVLTEEERLVVLLTFHVFIRAMEKNNLTYMLEGGTLLGSYRHHGLLPWDDDLDVLMNASDKVRVESALRAEGSGELLPSSTSHWKFSLRGLRRSPLERYVWPFVDIFFFLENDKFIWEEYHILGDGQVFDKRNVFPLSLRPFEGAFLPVPQDVESVLDNHYRPVTCASPSMCHKCDTNFHSAVSLPCTKLEGVYAFVSRVDLGAGRVREKLVIGTRVLHELEVPDPNPVGASNSYSVLHDVVLWFRRTFLM